MGLFPDKNNLLPGTTAGQFSAAMSALCDFIVQYLPNDGSKPLASNISNTPAGNITSTDQQAVNNELDGRVGAGKGTKNKIINGGFAVNQRGVSGTVTLAAGAYGHDRWKAGASGCTYTFATVENVTTLTITAGSLQQVIEGLNLQSGTHILSWSGTAQGKIGAGSYAVSGVTGTVTGGANLTIEFGTGTLSNVQFEPGLVATPFEMLDYGDVLRKCQRYFYKSYPQNIAPGTITDAGKIIGRTTANGYLVMPCPSKVTMRAISSVTNYSPRTGTSGRYSLDATSTDYAGQILNIGDNGFVMFDSGGGNDNLASVHYTLSSEL